MKIKVVYIMIWNNTHNKIIIIIQIVIGKVEKKVVIRIHV